MAIAADAERLGYESLWSPDHLLATYGPEDGSRFEGYMVLAGWAHQTSRVHLGLSVGAIAFRNPAMSVKIVTTLDHMSDGRAVLGIGAGWYEPEHRLYGYSMGHGAGERIAWLDEAVGIMRGMLDGTKPNGSRYYTISTAPNSPLPIQHHLPIMVGGRGERKILEVVAKHADTWNIPADVGLDGITRRIGTLENACVRHGRESSDIDWVLHCGLVVLRDSTKEAEDHLREMYRQLGVRGQFPDPGFYLGPSDGFVSLMNPYVGLGFRRFNVSFISPFDLESMSKIITDVKPHLDAQVASGVG